MLQGVVTLSDYRRPKGTEHPKSAHLNTSSISVAIAAGPNGENGSKGLDW